jgi:hypothetical protein
MENTMIRALMLATMIAASASAADNELTDQEKKDGWILMFDGKTTQGWMCGDKQGVYVSHFDRKFSDFHFKCEYKFQAKCNSGVFLRISRPGDNGIGRGFEVQVFDSFGKEKPDRQDCGALYELMAPSKNMVKKPGEWNSCEIICVGPKVKVILNGEQVIDADLEQWSKPGLNPDGSKNKFKWAFKDAPREGYIGLSDHQHDCWYRNIKVKPLTQESK